MSEQKAKKNKEKIGSLSEPTTKKRQLKIAKRNKFILRKRVKYEVKPLPKVRKLLSSTILILWHNKKLLGGILLIYGLVQLIFVKGLIASTQNILSNGGTQELVTTWGSLSTTLSVFSRLVNGGGRSVTSEGNLYQSLFILFSSLAIVWALRHIYAKKNVRIRDAYYKGMYPIIPTILVFLVIVLQTLPLFIGLLILQVVNSSGIIASWIEQVFVVLLCVVLALPSLYMICSSIIAVYVVTLPDMTPFRALRSARELVRHRRLQVFWRLMVLVIVSFSFTAFVLISIIFLIPQLAPYVYYVVSILLVGFVNVYLYGLYRELIDE